MLDLCRTRSQWQMWLAGDLTDAIAALEYGIAAAAESAIPMPTP